MTQPAAPPDTSVAVCVFAVCPRLTAPGLTGVTGHAGALSGVRSIVAGPLTAVVQDVPAARFTPEALHRRLTERDELERCARAHDEVVAALAATVPTVPLPLATLYLDEERARREIARNARRFLAALTRVAGRAEWGVKVYAIARQQTPERAAADNAAPLSGRAYLDRIRGRQRARESHRQTAVAAAERVDAAVRAMAVAARRLRPQEAAAGEHPGQVLNATYLVDSCRAPELAAAVAGLRGEPDIGGAVHVEVTGPWAPYSFAGGDEADDDD
jgi:gas vesicle protein GvpL/GvpF